MRGDRRRRFSGLPAGAAAAAILLLCVALALTHRELRETVRQARPLADAAAMARLEDRLLGRMLPERVNRDGAGPRAAMALPEGDTTEGRLTVLWVVDLGRCAECLGDLSGWHRLADYPELDRRVVLTGAPPRVVRRIAAETRLSSHLADPGGAPAIPEVTGTDPPPSLALLADASGRIIVADARDSGAACATDPMANVARILATIRREPGLQESGSPGVHDPSVLRRGGAP